MNLNNIADLLSQTKNYQNHRKKISSIMTKSVSVSDTRRQGVFTNFYSSKTRSNRYSFKSKQQAVQKENDLILKKIIAVNRKNNLKTMGSKNLSHNNLTNLKKSLQSINQENEKFAKKLVSTTSKLSQNALAPDYHKFLERRARLTKYVYDEEVGTVIPKKFVSLTKLKKLEPINSVTRMEGSRYGRSIREEVGDEYEHENENENQESFSGMKFRKGK